TGHATITVTAADGCVPSAGRFRAGGISLHVINKDATAVTEVEVLSGSRIVGEKENVPPGFSGDFAVTLPAGAYTLFCPGATPERRSIVVTGERAPADDSPVTALLAQASSGYAAYVSQQVGQLVTAAERLAAAVRGTDLAAAQRAYAGARPYYERIEPVAESFSVGGDDIDADIDARAGDVPAAQWRGMHVLERGLFQARSLDGLAPVADRLVDDVRRLQRLTATQRYQPTELANGAQELLDEVVASKITGEEERYSRLDLLDMTDNVVGSQQAFAQLRPALQRIDPALTATIAQRFAALDRAIDAYRDPSALGGVVRYTALTADDKRALAAAVKSVQEPLSTVAQKVAAQS
ncbi:MAG: iron uptake system protein EfeO, partial [Jatrophihabitans sp.]|uniref:iron uptake system protein EfeO n=1 Tax=Jatrophihabitans sp. TaxID=1932789 RepID=UPI003F7D573B